jgi:hypothetical protein
MSGKKEFPDRHERNDRWKTGMQLFLASTLSLIHTSHPVLDPDRELWLEITKRTFQNGAYSPKNENHAHKELTGATVIDSYLVLNNKYQLNILGSKPGLLGRDMERALLGWPWQLPEGIGYLNQPLSLLPPDRRAGHFYRWLTSLEMLARLFPAWVQFAKNALEWIWDQKNNNGYWDFGPRLQQLGYLPLSSTWRHKRNRIFD